MRGLAYVIAAVAAVGIMMVIAMSPSSDTAADPASSTPVSAENVMAEAGTMVLDVPSMHCEVACYPRVKEALEQASGVQSVELAEQAEEGVLDNRQVVVSYDAGFDLGDALALLSKEGFEDSAVAQ